MTNLKKWKKHEGSGGSNFFQFENNGDEIEGLWKGVIGKSPTYGTPIGGLDTVNGPISINLSMGLINQVEEIPSGTEIKVVYLGSKLNPKTKQHFKAFDVFINEEQDIK